MSFGDEHAHLVLLAVRATHQRRGIARRMTEWLLESAATAGIASIKVELRTDNAAAYALYRGLGFVEMLRAPGYYRGREAAIFMMRMLRPPGLEAAHVAAADARPALDGDARQREGRRSDETVSACIAACPPPCRASGSGTRPWRFARRSGFAMSEILVLIIVALGGLAGVRCAAGARDRHARGSAGSVPGAGTAISRRYRPRRAHSLCARRGRAASPATNVFVRVFRRRTHSPRRPSCSARRPARIAAARPLPHRVIAGDAHVCKPMSNTAA